MTDTQKKALKMMAESNTGAVLTTLGWTWPEDVRNSIYAAEAVIAAMTKPVTRTLSGIALTRIEQ